MFTSAVIKKSKYYLVHIKQCHVELQKCSTAVSQEKMFHKWPNLNTVELIIISDKKFHYGGGQSLRGWVRNRAAMSLEPKEAAKRKNDRQRVMVPKKRPKNHTGKLENVPWDEEALIAEVETY